MFRKTTIGLALVIVALALVSCSNSTGSPAPGGSPAGSDTVINQVDVTIVQPRKDVVPGWTAVCGNNTYSAAGVTWWDGETKIIGGRFGPGKAYTAKVTLTAEYGFTFTGLSNDKVKINGTYAPTQITNKGQTLDLSYLFPPTLAFDITNIAVTVQPTKLVYDLAEQLDLAGLVVSLTFENGSQATAAFGVIGSDGYEDFQKYALDTDPVQGQRLNLTENEKGVRVYYRAAEGFTAFLTVNIPGPATPEYPEGYPKTMNMANPLFWQFQSETVDWKGDVVPGVLSPLLTADGSARVWNIGGTDTLFVYASHDMLAAAGCDRMDRYHVFSTTDMKNWTDYGEIFNANDVPWHNGEFLNGSKFMWAPDCVQKDGLYYYYFPHPTQNSNSGAGSWGSNWQIGIAVSKHPASNFTILPTWLKGLNNGAQNQIDPHVFIDPDDGKAYFYNGGGGSCYGGKLKDSMIEIDGNMQRMDGLDNFHEATWVHKYNGKYYISYSDNGGGGPSNGDQLKYATSTSPLGPWTPVGPYVYATGNGTIHGSIVKFKEKWYAFYHSDYVTYVGNDQGRSVHVDELKYNDDGTIQVVKTFGIPRAGVNTTMETNGDPDICALSLKAVDFNDPPEGFNEIAGVNDGGRTYGYLSRHDKESGGTTVNTNYRNTVGMAIEGSGDSAVLGELEDREFVRYTINVPITGDYDVDVYAASSTATGSFFLVTNGATVPACRSGNDLAPRIVPNTNGAFQKMRVSVPLVKGDNVFELRVVRGGFKLQKFEFFANIVPIVIDVVADGMDKKFRLQMVLAGPLDGIVTMSESPYDFTPIRFENLVQDDTLDIELPYYSGFMFKFTITTTDSSTGGTPKEREYNYDIKFDRSFADTYDGEVGLNTGATPLLIANTQACVTEGPWDGPDDCSMAGNAKWDDDNFYLYLEVKDDIYYSTYGSNGDIWQGDGIQVVVGPTNKHLGGTQIGNELGFARHTDGTIYTWRWFTYTGTGSAGGPFPKLTGETDDQYADRFKITWNSVTNKMIYNLTLPWKYIMATDTLDKTKALGLSILMNDSDGNGTSRLAFEYGKGINSPKNYNDVTDLWLVDDFGAMLMDKAEEMVSRAEGAATNKMYHDIARNFVALIVDPTEKASLTARLDNLGL